MPTIKSFDLPLTPACVLVNPLSHPAGSVATRCTYAHLSGCTHRYRGTRFGSADAFAFFNPIFRGGKVLWWAEILAHNYLVMAERRRNSSQPTEKAAPALSLLVAVCSCSQRLWKVREVPEEWAWHEQHGLEMDTDVSGIFLRSLWSEILYEVFSVIGHKCKCSIHYGGYLWFAFCINTEIQCSTLQFPCFRLSSVNTLDQYDKTIHRKKSGNLLKNLNHICFILVYLVHR